MFRQNRKMTLLQVVMFMVVLLVLSTSSMVIKATTTISSNNNNDNQECQFSSESSSESCSTTYSDNTKQILLLPWIPPDEPTETDFRPRGAADLHPNCQSQLPKQLLLPKLEEFPSQSILQYLSTPDNNHAFIMLNGKNSGIRLQYSSNCLGTFASDAYRILVQKKLPTTPFRSSLFLYSSTGLPIRTSGDIQSKRARGVIYLLLEDETWVHPFYSVGFEFTIAGFLLQTISDRPRVFLIKNFTSPEIAQAIIDRYSKNLDVSPEKHYSPGFENYRTSLTGWMSSRDDRNAYQIRHDIYRITRLPYLSYVEEPQFLKYDVGKWYRPHHDYFHHWKKSSRYEAIKFVRERMIWLIEHYQQIKNPIHVELANLLRKVINLNTIRDESVLLDEKFIVMKSSTVVLTSVLALSPQSKPLPRYVILEMCAAAKYPCDDELKSDLIGNSPQGMMYITTALAKRIVKELIQLQSSSDNVKNENQKEWLSLLSFDPTIDTLSSIQQNRHATLLPYLSNVEEGGETVIPNAIHPELYLGKNFSYPVRPGMNECSKGLVISPQLGSASLFYHRTPTGELDVLALHGGCPPQRGIKYAINGFTWNVNSDKMGEFFH
jgi:hypothetical protein